MAIAYLSLGSNLGNRAQYLEKALKYLELHTIKVLQTSNLYETEPVGFTEQPWFLNQVIQIQTELSPQKLLNILQKAEKNAGRMRSILWGPRTLDIDILFYNNEIIKTDKLIVPHPLLHERKFVLQPLTDIAPHFHHPVFQKTVEELLKLCKDTTIVRSPA